MAFGIGEAADDEVSPGCTVGAHRSSPAEALRFLQRRLYVRYAYVEEHARLVAVAAADATVDPRPTARRSGVHESIVACLGDCLRNRAARVELPAEQVAVVAAQLCRISSDDLEVNYWLCLNPFRS